ncbi:MAG: alpha/beta hydrolase fold domain-containing protein [Myxococcota bacterium]
MPDAPTLFLSVSLIGVAFTWNAYSPRRPQTWLAIPSFFAGWLTSEMPVHHIAWQLVATVGFAAAGALSAWPGWLGLGLSVVSWAALMRQVSESDRCEQVVDAALREALGDAAGPLQAPLERVPARPQVNPFRFARHDVEVRRDVRYAEGAGRRRLLDVYAPADAPRDAPVLFQVHGGAWVIGDKREQALPLMHHMASRGWICVAANYRLSPRATFPDHLVDLKLAVRWIRENIADFGGDPDFVAATGGSAGGHLSALLALTANDPEYQPDFEHVDTTVRACVPFYGIYDFANRFERDSYEGFERFLARTVFKKRLAEDRVAYEKASPVARVHADAPPFFVIHGSHDSLAPVDEARDFVSLLREVSKSPVAYAEIPGAQHAFEIFHSVRTTHVVRGVDRFLTAVHRGAVHRPAQPIGLGGADDRAGAVAAGAAATS